MGSDNETQTRRSTRGRGRGRGRPPGRPAKKTKSPKKPPKSEKAVKKEKEIEIKDKDIENNGNTSEKRNDSLSDLKTSIDCMFVLIQSDVYFIKLYFCLKVEESIESELTSLSFVTPASKALHGNEPLNWKYKVNLIGEKVVNPRIHCCERCLLPILVYGRMVCFKLIY